jgi:hypothetical protein
MKTEANSSAEVYKVKIDRPVTWTEAKSIVEKEGGCLPTKEDIKDSGHNANVEDLWMPVHREDGVENDWC